MRNYLPLVLAWLAISFALLTFAQHKVDQRAWWDSLGKKFSVAHNNNDAAALAALFTKDAVLVTDTGPIYGREAIEKWYADVFKNVHFSNHIPKLDQYSRHVIGAAGYEVWCNGEWSATIQGKDWGPTNVHGYFGMIDVLEDGVLKCRMETYNVTPAPPPAAAPSPTASPSNQ